MKTMLRLSLILLVCAALLCLAPCALAEGEETVTIHFNGESDSGAGTGAMDDQVVPKEVIVTLNANTFTAPAGKIFAGWNTKRDGSGSTFQDKAAVRVSKDITLYALWVDDTCTLTFDKNSDEVSGEVYTQSVPKGVATRLEENRFVPPAGLLFNGWNTKRDGSGTSFKDKASVKVSRDATLYAQWKEDLCTVTFDKNSDAVSGEEYTQTVRRSVTINLVENRYVPPEGLLFNGWNTEPDGSGTAFRDKAALKVHRDATLYAQWVPVRTVTFDKNAEDAAGTMDPQTVGMGVSTQLSANAFTRVNHGFAGWSENPEGIGELIANGASVTLEEDMTLYAVWRRIAYAVTYDANGGSGEQMEQQNVGLGSTAHIRDCAYDPRPGEIFVCWQDAEDAELYYPGDTTVLTGDLALKAVWAEEPPADPDFVLPAALTTIEEEAFTGGAFRYVRLSENTLSIGANAFGDCPNLAWVYIPEATAEIDPQAFGGMTDLTILGHPGSAAQAYAKDHGFVFIAVS